jgi:hypothetical protein
VADAPSRSRLVDAQNPGALTGLVAGLLWIGDESAHDCQSARNIGQWLREVAGVST